ncbi:MAG: hypothetical protein ACRC3F_19235, partial [Billgrantia desiderata]
MTLARLRAGLLVIVTLATLCHLVFVSVTLQTLGVIALVGYLFTLRGRLSPMALGLLMAAGMASLMALWQAEAPGRLLLEAAGRFAFFATFVVALSLLRLPAYRSRLVRRCGSAMLMQP